MQWRVDVCRRCTLQPREETSTWFACFSWLGWVLLSVPGWLLIEGCDHNDAATMSSYPCCPWLERRMWLLRLALPGEDAPTVFCILSTGKPR